MRWKLIPEGPYRPFHSLTFESPLAAVGAFGAKPAVEPCSAQDDQGRSVPPWLPVINTVIKALEPFHEAGLAVSDAIQNLHPELFE